MDEVVSHLTDVLTKLFFRLIPTGTNCQIIIVDMTPLNVFLLLEGVWCLSIGYGIWNNNYPKPEDAALPLLSFDFLLRRIGPLLPLLVFTLRVFTEKWLAPRPSIR